MRLQSDNYYDNMSKEMIKEKLESIEEYDEEEDGSKSLSDLIEKIKKYERTRHLAFWHDGSTVSNHSHILMTVSCMYDKAVYLSDAEYQNIHGRLLCKTYPSQ